MAADNMICDGNWKPARRHMRCDNFHPRCEEQDESANHAIFECPISLQACTLSSTPSTPNIFFLSQYFHKLGLPIMEEKGIEDPAMDRDSYLWIIWYLCKGRNDKLFGEIDRTLWS